MNMLTSFKGRIITTSILLLSLSLAVSTFLSYRQLSTSVFQNVDRHSMKQVENTSDEITNWLHNVKNGLIATAPDFTVPHSDANLVSMVTQINKLLKICNPFCTNSLSKHTSRLFSPAEHLKNAKIFAQDFTQVCSYITCTDNYYFFERFGQSGKELTARILNAAHQRR